MVSAPAHALTSKFKMAAITAARFVSFLTAEAIRGQSQQAS